MPIGGEAAARTFYGQVLGLREVAKPLPLADRGGCWFVGPGIQLHLGVEAEFLPARKAHPAFLVHDLGAFQQHMHNAGIAIAVDTTLSDVQRCYANDPFGNRIEFLQHGDGFSQRAIA
jgi:catechol 2,3-dioxygenase-like lactoylglutathione lyase family enzyme